MSASIPAFCAEPEGLPAAAMRRSRLSAWFRVTCHSTHLYLGLFVSRTNHAVSLQASSCLCSTVQIAENHLDWCCIA